MVRIACVFIGAGCGAVVRWGLTLLAGRLYPGMSHMGTLAANLTSCLLVGAVAVVFLVKVELPVEARLLVITGFCGGLSTMSALSLETVQLFGSGDFAWRGALLASVNLLLNVFGCLAATGVGMHVARKICHE